jgi:uncharacterized protein YndB with AHSA1/START domain
MWFDLRRMSLEDAARAPFGFDNRADIAAPPERVFALFADGNGMGRWLQDFVACRWTSPEPHGVGSEREVELALFTVKERFLAWDPGKRIAFSIDAITLPLLAAAVEDLQLAPSASGGTQVRWRVHYAPSLAMRLVHPLARVVFGRLFRNSLAALKRLAEQG